MERGTGGLVTATTEKLWAVAVGLGNKGYYSVIRYLESLAIDLTGAVEIGMYWYGRLTEPERCEALASAILEVGG